MLLYLYNTVVSQLSFIVNLYRIALQIYYKQIFLHNTYLQFQPSSYLLMLFRILQNHKSIFDYYILTILHHKFFYQLDIQLYLFHSSLISIILCFRSRVYFIRCCFSATLALYLAFALSYLAKSFFVVFFYFLLIITNCINLF